MSEIKVGKNETLESALRRFNLKQQENANSEHKMITLILPFHGFMKFRIRVSLFYPMVSIT